VVSEALRKGISVEEIHNITTMDVFFIHKFKNIVNLEKELRSKSINKALLTKAKMYGFTDKSIAKLCNKTEKYIKQLRIKNHIIAQFKTVDTCGGEFKAHSDYYYSSYDEGNEVNTKKTKKKILIIGSGPIRIGQGIEFDYCSVHCV
jgi:carbamoyl-phosphate synthase large subunit